MLLILLLISYNMKLNKSPDITGPGTYQQCVELDEAEAGALIAVLGSVLAKASERGR